jgi:hypothetical protein
MKLKTILGWSSALCLCVPLCGSVRAQETNQPADVDQRLKQWQEIFEKRQHEMQEQFERKTAAQDAEIEALKRQLAGTATNPPPPAAGTPSTNTVTPAQLKSLNDKVNEVVEAQKKNLMSEFNPAIGLVGETIFSYDSKGSDQTGSDHPGGFNVNQRSIELNVAASVDPFAKGYAVVNASADSATGDATMNVEEAALQTTSLPWNLELKGGIFFAEFGRLAYIHDHELPFVNRPLVLDQYIDGESKTAGAQANWLFPTAHYVSLSAGFGDQFGDEPNNPGTYRTLGKLNYFGRLSTYFDLTPDWQLETGVSGMINPRTEDRGGAITQPNGVSTLTEKERRLAGFDVKLSYVPLQNNQFRSLTWGTEVLYSGNRYLSDPDGVPDNGDEFDEDIGAWGMYSYVTWKWSRRWSGGFLFDFVQSDQNGSAKTYAYSPYITWAISHWNQLRLQYTHTQPDAATGEQPNDAIYLQWAWIIGSHSHGWQQR